MSWNAAKRAVLACLELGYIQFEQRSNIDVKNLLATGEMSPGEVAEILRRARGSDHSMSKHHVDRRVTVHLVRRRGWYIKWYFLEPDAVFISVHEEEY